MTQRQIHLTHTPHGWMARFVGDETVLAVFGTDTIPTAYTAQAPVDEVITGIRARNPGCAILVTPPLRASSR